MSPSAERYQLLFEHYKLAVEDVARMNDRRRVNCDVYIGLNTFLLTGMVFLLSLSHMSSWLLPGLFLIITILAGCINFTWRHSLESYRRMINLRIEFICQAEQNLHLQYQQLAAPIDQPIDIGIFVKEAQFSHLPGFTRVELQLIRLFFGVYPLITLGTILLTYLMVNHKLPPMSL